jgi:hypothetical protein
MRASRCAGVSVSWMAATGWAGEAEGAGAACVEADSAAKVRHSQAQGLSGVMVIPGQWVS